MIRSLTDLADFFGIRYYFSLLDLLIVSLFRDEKHQDLFSLITYNLPPFKSRRKSMKRSLFIMLALSIFQIGFANPISELFEKLHQEEIFFIRVKQGTKLGLKGTLPEGFQIAYAPEGLLTCEFIPEDESLENWSEMITVNFYPNAEVQNIAPMYKSFVLNLGGEEMFQQQSYGEFWFEENEPSFSFSDHIHMGPHVMPHLNLRSCTEQEVGASRFIQTEKGVFQTSYIIKLNNNKHENPMKVVKNYIYQWKISKTDDFFPSDASNPSLNEEQSDEGNTSFFENLREAFQDCIDNISCKDLEESIGSLN